MMFFDDQTHKNNLLYIFPINEEVPVTLEGINYVISIGRDVQFNSLNYDKPQFLTDFPSLFSL